MKGKARKKSKRVEEVKKIDSRFLRGGATAAMASLDGQEEDDAMLNSLLEGLDDDDDDDDDEGGLDTNKLQDMAIFAPQSKIQDQVASNRYKIKSR